MSNLLDRLAVTRHRRQLIDRFPRVLFLCSAGCIRSPTAALVVGYEFGRNTRCCGVSDFAITQLDEVILMWAYEIVCMDDNIREELVRRVDRGEFSQATIKDKIVVLSIPDIYDYREPALVHNIRVQYPTQTKIPLTGETILP